MTVAVEPNHENEIVSGRNSVGDYNPRAWRGSTSISSRFTGTSTRSTRKWDRISIKNSSMLPVDCCGAIGIDMILKTAISESGSNTTGSKFTGEWGPVTGSTPRRVPPRTDQKPPNSRLLRLWLDCGYIRAEIRISPY